MLSRTAENLFWLARYVERAENVARLLDVGLHMSGLLIEAAVEGSEWHSTIVAAGCEESFYRKYKEPTAEAVLRHLAQDFDNPSSIMSCLATARRNSRAVRTALTVDMWEAVNSTYLQAQAFGNEDFTQERIRRFLDWVKERSQLFGGAVISTMLRNDAFWFTRLGTFVERADNTARILDVKYHVLLPSYESVGGTLDYYQWTAILRAVSALRAYHWVYLDRLKPWLIAELLILRPEMPRSLVTCTREIANYLELLSGAYGGSGECHRRAGQMYSRLTYGKIDEVFQRGLHEFLTDFIDNSVELGNEIARQYLA